MKKYYVKNNKIVINKYCVAYICFINNPDSDTKSEITQYVSDEAELNALTAELNQKNIDFNVTELDTDGILKYNGLIVQNEEEARKLIEPSLDEVVPYKLNQISNDCKKKIYDGIDIALSDGTVKHFSLKIEDQINMNRLFSIYKDYDDNCQILYHADSEPYTLFSKKDFLHIFQKTSEFISYETQYCNNLMKYIQNIKNVDEVLTINYGAEI